MNGIAVGLGFYRACGDRCAFHLSDSKLSRRETCRQLLAKGFQLIEVDVVTLAKNLAGKSKWKWAARSWHAPDYFDCSSFTKWLYAQKGIWIPRRARQQYEHCNVEPIHKMLGNKELHFAQPGDLLFVSSPYSGGRPTKRQTNLHVGIVVPGNKMICATNSELGRGIVEISFDQLFSTRKFRGIGHPTNGYFGDENPVTLITPREREIETTDDLKWVLSAKGKRR